jgi:hypothetical protein
MERRKLDTNAGKKSTQRKGTDGLRRFRLAIASLERRLATPTEDFAQRVASVDAGGGLRFRVKPDRRLTVALGIAVSRPARAHE